MIVSGSFKCDVSWLKCQHEGEAAKLLTSQPRDIMFECCTRFPVSFFLSYDHLLKFENFEGKKLLFLTFRDLIDLLLEVVSIHLSVRLQKVSDFF